MAADFITKAVISRLFYAYAQVYVDEGRPEPAVAKVIWKTPGEGAVPSPIAGPQRTAAEDAPAGGPEAESTGLTLFFDDSWQAKLKTELDS